jgi:hypothetical protein
VRQSSTVHDDPLGSLFDDGGHIPTLLARCHQLVERDAVDCAQSYRKPRFKSG